MKSRGNENLRRAIQLLKAKGASNIKHCCGGKHIKLMASFRGSSIIITMSGTPSDWRAGRNAMACLKRRLRAAAANDNDWMK